jgi:hypothetical protein
VEGPSDGNEPPPRFCAVLPPEEEDGVVSIETCTRAVCIREVLDVVGITPNVGLGTALGRLDDQPEHDIGLFGAVRAAAREDRSRPERSQDAAMHLQEVSFAFAWR